MYKTQFRVLAVAVLSVFSGGCGEDTEVIQIIGGDGTSGLPATSLEFELTWVAGPDGARPDLDLYVIDPSGQTFGNSGVGRPGGANDAPVDQDDTGFCGGGRCSTTMSDRCNENDECPPGEICVTGERIELAGPFSEGLFTFGINYVQECASPSPEPVYTLRVFVNDAEIADSPFQGTAESGGGLTTVIPVGAVPIRNE